MPTPRTVKALTKRPTTAMAPTAPYEPSATSTDPMAGPRARPSAIDDWASPTRSSGARDHEAMERRMVGVAIQKKNPHKVSPTRKSTAFPPKATSAAQTAVPRIQIASGRSPAVRRAAISPARALPENPSDTTKVLRPTSIPIAPPNTKREEPARVPMPSAKSRTTFDLDGLRPNRFVRYPT